jgi:hydrophobic/amphiphilic exporter-1 (mainly G- bacteria), HAE1 family
MRALVALCIRRPVFTWVLVLSTVVLGLDALRKMPIERFPNIEFPFVQVMIAAPGMSAVQVESEISTRVENAIGTVSGLDRLESFSYEGQSLVWVQFVLGKDPAVAANEVRDRIARLGDQLPRVTRPPRIETFNANAAPIVLVALDSAPADARTPLELTEIADTMVRRELQTVSGVGDVRLVGGEVRALSVVLDPLRLRALDLSAHEVQRALERENVELPGGSVADGDTSLGVRLSACASSASELAQVVVAKRGDLNVQLADLGRVLDGAAVSSSRATIDGRAAVMVLITQQPGQNTVRVADEVRDRLAKMAPHLPSGVRARIIQDNSEDVRAAVEAVAEHLILGAVMAALVVFLFLRSMRATLISGLAIPTSILGSFAAAHALGITLNLLSLLGLTLAVGIVIDDAIVVLENIVRVMGEKKQPASEAAADAAKEIGLAVLATTLSLVAVFLPVATMEGIVGRYLAPFSLTMSVSILLSMGVAFTLTPMLSARWLRPRDAHLEHGASLARGQGRFELWYCSVVAWSLRKRWVIGVGIVLTVLSIFPLGRSLPATFIPQEDLRRFSLYVRLPDRASVERTAQLAEELAARIREMPSVANTVVMTRSSREATVSVYLDRAGAQDTMIAGVRTMVAERVPADVLTMVGPMDEFAPPGPDSAPIQFVIRGGDLSELRSVAGKLLEAARNIPGTVDHGITTAGEKPELAVVVDRAHASKLGVSHSEIGSALTLIDREGVEFGTVRDTRSNQEVALKVRLRVASDSLAPEDLVRLMTVRTDGGALLPLSDVARLERTEGPGLIRRSGRERQITLFMNTVPGTSDAEVVRAIEARLASIDPTGRHQGDVIGNAKEMQSAATAFLIAIVLSFVFMYLILAAQFESWIHPVTILMSLPLTVPFGLLSLAIGMQTLNVFSSLGFLVLFGVVKKNSILQVDRIIQLRAAGFERDEAVVQACRDRLRPILMTTLAFVAGMLPLVLSSGAGAATNRAVAVGTLGGQTLSLALTLVATPVAYTFFDDGAHWFARVFGRKPKHGARADA